MDVTDMFNLLDACLIPDVITLVLDYVSLVELTELGISVPLRGGTEGRLRTAPREVPPTHIWYDSLALTLYSQSRHRTYSIENFSQLPDYFRYAVLLHSKRKDSHLKRLLAAEPSYIVDWLIRSPRLRWDDHTIGHILISTAVEGNNDVRIIQILQNPSIQQSDEFTLKLSKLVYGIRHRADERLAVYIIQHYDLHRDYIMKILLSAVRMHTTPTLNAILTWVEENTIQVSLDLDDDPLETAIQCYPEIIPRLIQARLFIPWSNYYVSALATSNLKSEHVDMVLNVLDHSVEKFDELTRRHNTVKAKMLRKRYYQLRGVAYTEDTENNEVGKRTSQAYLVCLIGVLLGFAVLRR